MTLLDFNFKNGFNLIIVSMDLKVTQPFYLKQDQNLSPIFYITFI